ncbi:MAG: hypothetical protein KC474_03870 [Cyanobacteria bacterium HKST-UBA04]|nr:hypothetical protein [Cyanobacteria bacterium HKST-UBA04]
MKIMMTTPLNTPPTHVRFGKVLVNQIKAGIPITRNGEPLVVQQIMPHPNRVQRLGDLIVNGPQHTDHAPWPQATHWTTMWALPPDGEARLYQVPLRNGECLDIDLRPDGAA